MLANRRGIAIHIFSGRKSTFLARQQISSSFLFTCASAWDKHFKIQKKTFLSKHKSSTVSPCSISGKECSSQAINWRITIPCPKSMMRKEQYTPLSVEYQLNENILRIILYRHYRKHRQEVMQYAQRIDLYIWKIASLIFN